MKLSTKNCFILAILFFIVSCNPAKRIVNKKRNIDKDCADNIIWLYDSFIKKNGLLKVKIRDFEKDKDFQFQLHKRYFNDFDFCMFKNLSQKEVKKLFGEPNRITHSERNAIETYKYFVMSNTCKDTFALQKAFLNCGFIRFEFDENGNPIDGYMELK